jgi:hypothetical protein
LSFRPYPAETEEAAALALLVPLEPLALVVEELLWVPSAALGVRGAHQGSLVVEVPPVLTRCTSARLVVAVVVALAQPTRHFLEAQAVPSTQEARLRLAQARPLALGLVSLEISFLLHLLGVNSAGSQRQRRLEDLAVEAEAQT